MAWLPVVVLALPLLSGGLGDPRADEIAAAPPRLGVPTAYTVGERAAAAYYRLNGATFAGRTLVAHEGGARLGVLRGLEVGIDVVDILARGKNPGNYLEASATALSMKQSAQPWNGASVSLGLEYRSTYAAAYVVDGSVLPPPGRVYRMDAGFTTRVLPALTLHAQAAAARLAVGAVLKASTINAALGADYAFFGPLTLQANAAAYRNGGDTRGTDVALSGGLHAGGRSGFFVDVLGTLWPTGVPLVGGPLADAAMFRIEPVVQSQPLGKQLTSATLGVVTGQVGFRAEW